MLPLLLGSLAAAHLAVAPDFVDVTASLGLAIGNDAACWADLDQDGWPDLVAGGAAWRNDKGRRFSKLADVGASVAADYDNDGYPDLFAFQQTKLWHNEKGKGFKEVPLPAHPPTVSRGACWGDFDGDGFVDLYVGGFEDWDKQVTYPSFILTNRREKGFELTWKDASYRTRGVTACDFDQDGDLDVYASNYRLQPNRLWVNDGRGVLTDQAASLGALATSPGFEGGHSIGAAWGDFDGDGLFDLFAGNFAHVDGRGDQPKSRFLRNQDKTKGFAFEDKGTCGVFYQESYASPAAADYDNDGDLDLFFTTVYLLASFDRPNHPVLFRNDGGFAFADATEGSGLERLLPTYQAAWADFDRDGRIDLVTAGKLFANRTAKGHWLGVRLIGDGTKIDRSAVGAQVRVRTGDKVLVRHVEAGTGEGNQNDLTLHFGLGGRRTPIDIVVTWPGNRRQTVRRVPVDRILTVRFHK